MFSYQAAGTEVSCAELRKKGLALSMLTTPTPKDLAEVQSVIDDLILYKKNQDAEAIMNSKQASDYLKLNNYCLFLGSLDRILKIYIRSYEIVDLSEDQKEIIKKKSLTLIKNILEKPHTSQAILVAQGVILELADLGHFKNSINELKNLKNRNEDFKKLTDERRKALIGLIKNEKDRTKVRKEFYKKDLAIGQGELKFINLFLPKD